MRHTFRGWTLVGILAALLLCRGASSDPELARLRIVLDGKPMGEAYHARYDGRELYVSLALLRTLGCTVTVSRREESALVRTPDKAEREIALTRLSGVLMVALSDVAGLLDLTYRVQKDSCEVETPAYRHARREARPAAGEGERAGPRKPGQPDRNDSQPLEDPDAKPAQIAATEAGNKSKAEAEREAVPTRPGVPGETPVKPGAPDKAGQVQQGDTVDAPPSGIKSADAPPPQGERQSLPSRGATVAGAAPSGPHIRDIVCEAVDPAQARLRILADGQVSPRVTMLKDEPALAVDIPGAILSTETRTWAFAHPLVASVEALAGPAANITRLLVRLSRLVTFKAKPTPPDGFEISLRLPRLTGRRIEEMTVVIDPGHGGPSATGCSAMYEGQRIYEKNLTLSMARKVYERLRQMGMNVIMTRTDDTAVGLADRPRLANDNNADLFLSIHVDYAPENASASGTTAYYHGNDENGRALAYVLARSVARAGGLPNRGARSDLERFVTGMAVLRRAEMPAVLLEVAFLSNPKDRAKLLREDFQASVADAIADGVRAYVEARIPGLESSPGGGQ